MNKDNMNEFSRTFAESSRKGIEKIYADANQGAREELADNPKALAHLEECIKGDSERIDAIVQARQQNIENAWRKGLANI